ncbi:MAG: hypothetical protein KC656_34205, partial [Myxococcales bacterium]|nr:hypothetical protein [Myxococcales bacterium]
MILLALQAALADPIDVADEAALASAVANGASEIHLVAGFTVTSQLEITSVTHLYGAHTLTWGGTTDLLAVAPDGGL